MSGKNITTVKIYFLRFFFMKRSDKAICIHFFCFSFIRLFSINADWWMEVVNKYNESSTCTGARPRWRCTGAVFSETSRAPSYASTCRLQTVCWPHIAHYKYYHVVYSTHLTFPHSWLAFLTISDKVHQQGHWNVIRNRFQSKLTSFSGQLCLTSVTKMLLALIQYAWWWRLHSYVWGLIKAKTTQQ